MAKPSTPFKQSWPRFTPDQIQENVGKLTGGIAVGLDRITAASPVEIPEAPFEQAQLFLRTLFAADAMVNIVCAFSATDGVVHPVGCGHTKTARLWCELMGKKQDVPKRDAGTWVRINPITATGTGKGDAYCDVDVLRFDYTLIEFDDLPIEQQAAVLARLPLPVASICTSGSRSLHALVKIDAGDIDAYKATARQILARLAALGADRSNSNPSRMTRLPGGIRKFGVDGDGKQRLLYLNPDPKLKPIIGD